MSSFVHLYHTPHMQLSKDQPAKVKDTFPASRHGLTSKVHTLAYILTMPITGLVTCRRSGTQVSHTALILTFLTFVLVAGGRAGGTKSRLGIARGAGNRLYNNNKHNCTLLWPIPHVTACISMITQYFAILTSGVLAFREHCQLFATFWPFPSRFRPVKPT